MSFVDSVSGRLVSSGPHPLTGPVEVAVVGGGPAGLAAAARAAAAGLKVVVLERDAAIGEPVRTSGGSFIAPLRQLGVPRACWWPVRRIRILSPGAEVAMRYRRPVACVLDVRATYQWLAQQAALAGAQIRLKASVSGPLLDGDTVRGVGVRDPFHGVQDLAARVVVDASGHAGVIARPAGLRAGADRSAVGLEVEVHAPRYDQDEALLIVGESVAPGGYGWAFPCGRERVRVGVGVVRPDSTAEPRVLLDALLSRLPALAGALVGAAPLELHAGVMPALRPGAARLVGDGVVVVGDAAGQGSTLLGEGIRHAIHAGRLAGETVAAAAADGFSASSLVGYPQAWEQATGREFRLAYALHGRLCQYRDDDWDRVLGVLARLGARQFSQVLQGRFTLRWALGLLVTRPHVVLGAGRPLLRAALTGS